MRIKIICVGRIKERYLTDAIAEYSKRLSKFCTLEICEVEDEMTPDKASDSLNNDILQKEAKRIEKNIRSGEFVITMEIDGTQYDSVSFSQKLDQIKLQGNSCIDFIIGGSLGLHDSIKKQSNMKISFSKMTFPHQLMRVILLEQVYRAFKISANEPYHK